MIAVLPWLALTASAPMFGMVQHVETPDNGIKISRLRLAKDNQLVVTSTQFVKMPGGLPLQQYRFHRMSGDSLYSAVGYQGKTSSIAIVDNLTGKIIRLIENAHYYTMHFTPDSKALIRTDYINNFPGEGNLYRITIHNFLTGTTAEIPSLVKAVYWAPNGELSLVCRGNTILPVTKNANQNGWIVSPKPLSGNVILNKSSARLTDPADYCDVSGRNFFAFHWDLIGQAQYGDKKLFGAYAEGDYTQDWLAWDTFERRSPKRMYARNTSLTASWTRDGRIFQTASGAIYYRDRVELREKVGFLYILTRKGKQVSIKTYSTPHFDEPATIFEL